MNENELKAGLAELEELAEREYHQPLETVVSAANDPAEVVARLGRLIGVSMKQPLAYAEDLEEPSSRTKAYRRWRLHPEAVVESAADTWQYATLEALRTDPEVIARRGELRSVFEVADDAQYERGFFGHLAASARAYICGDPEIRKKVEQNVANAKKSGLNVSLNAPEVIVGSGGVALGGYLVTVVPILGFVGVPVIAGIVLLLYTIGVDAFCKWTDEPDVQEAETAD